MLLACRLGVELKKDRRKRAVLPYIHHGRGDLTILAMYSQAEAVTWSISWGWDRVLIS